MRGLSIITASSIDEIVFNFDHVHCVEGNIFVDRRNSRYGVANEANFVNAERVFILADWKNSI
jgi:hypothetical protein